MTQLAQAYIHLKPYTASEQRVRSLGRYAKRVAIRAAAEIYGGDVEIEVQIEEGSLITRVTVAGSILLGVYGFVANYKGFKEGVVEMCNDARDVCGPFITKAGVAKEDVYRFERRLKTPGKLYRFSKRLPCDGSERSNQLASNKLDLQPPLRNLLPKTRNCNATRRKGSRLTSAAYRLKNLALTDPIRNLQQRDTERIEVRRNCANVYNRTASFAKCSKLGCPAAQGPI